MLVCFYQFSEKVKETPLRRQGANFIVGAPEVTDQYSFEQQAENLLYHGRAPTFGNYILADTSGGKKPQPLCYSIQAPTGFISMQYSTFCSPLANGFIAVPQMSAQSIPGMSQPTGAHFDAGYRREHRDQVINFPLQAVRQR